VCRRDEDFELVTLPDSDSELESGEFAEFEKVIIVVIIIMRFIVYLLPLQDVVINIVNTH